MKTLLIIAAAAGALYVSSATADEYYVVRKPHSRDCKIVTTAPHDTTWVQVGPMAFKTRDEAAKREVNCREHDDD